MKYIILNILGIFAFLNCGASNTKSLPIYYSVNQSFVDIIDSISSVKIEVNHKKTFQKQEFYVFFFCKENNLLVYISHSILCSDEFENKYAPFGCVIKNDSFFYLINRGVDQNQIKSLFHKTENKIVLSLTDSSQHDVVEVVNNEPIFFIFRPAKLFILENGKFINALKTKDKGRP